MRNITRTSSRTKPSTLPSAAPTRNSSTNSAVCKVKDQPKLAAACLRMPKKSKNIARSTQALSTPDTSPAAAMSRKGHDPNCSSTKTIGRKRVQSLDYEIRTPTMRSSLDFNYSCSSNSSSLSVDETSMPITPAMFCSGIVDQDDIPECSGDSLLEALPFDVLVCILCGLNHDELKPLFHVCKRLRKAVESAMQSHFNFTTPYQRRQRMLQFSTPRPFKCRSFSRFEPRTSGLGFRKIQF